MFRFASDTHNECHRGGIAIFRQPTPQPTSSRKRSRQGFIKPGAGELCLSAATLLCQQSGGTCE